MTKKSLHFLVLALVGYTIIGGGYLLAGDGKNATSPEVSSGPNAAHLWAQNCQQCHNLRPASAYSDAQLQVIVHHMRVRSHITGEEQSAILAFLKEAN